MFKFPFGTLQELNLDWIIEKIREFAETGTKTKEPLTFTFSDGTEQTFDGEEAVTIDLAGADISGKLDKYTGAGRKFYGTINGNQAMFNLPVDVAEGGTGATNASDARLTLGAEYDGNKVSAIAAADEASTTKYPAIKAIVDWCISKFVAQRTTVGAWMYYHDGSTEGEKPLGYTPGADTVAMRNADGNVQTNDPVANLDAVNKQTLDPVIEFPHVPFKALTGRILNQTAADLYGNEGHYVSASNDERVITVDGNIIHQYPVNPGTAAGTTSNAYLISGTPRFLIGNTVDATVIGAELVDADFKDFNVDTITDLLGIDHATSNLFFSLSIASENKRPNTAPVSSRIYLYTKNMNTGVISGVYFAAVVNQDIPISDRCAIRNLYSALPELSVNKNIAIVFVSRYARMDQTFIFDFLS